MPIVDPRATRCPDIWDSNSIESEIKYRVKGEKWGFHRTDVLKKFPFPEPENVKFISESVVWHAISKHYKTRYINEILRIYHVNKCKSRLTTLSKKIAEGRIYGHRSILNDGYEYLIYNPIYLMK